MHRTLLPCLLAGLLAASLAQAHDQIPAAAPAGPLLVRGGDLYTVAQGVLPATDLLVVDGKIAAIGKNLPAPAGARVLDASGQRVYPGLIATGTTLGLIEINAVRATNDLAEVPEIAPEVSARTAYNPDSELLPTVRVHGVTTVQVVPQGELLRGRSFLTHLDGWTVEDAGVVAEDGLHLSWPRAAVARGFRAGSPDEQRAQAEKARTTLRHAFDDARAYHLARTAGQDVAPDLRWEAMRPLFEGKLPLFVHADDAREIREAVAFAQQHKLRMILVGGREAPAVAELLKQADVPVLVGSTLELPTRVDDAYDQPFRVPAQLAAAGVRFAITHANGGATEQRNLPFQAATAVAFGLSKEAALRALTLSPAEILGVADRLGSLEVGKEATLFLSKGDVLDALSQQVTVVLIRGREVDLDNRHRQLYRKYQEKLKQVR
jgi:imidazolonepropionase-like amidohydrolase